VQFSANVINDVDRRATSDGLPALIETLVTPTVFVFGIMQPTREMGVVVESIGRSLSFVVILAVVTCGRLLLGSFPNDAELLMCVFNNLL
jgi:hypothetical protein